MIPTSLSLPRILHYVLGLFCFSLLVSMAGIEIFSALCILLLLGISFQNKFKNKGNINFLYWTGLEWPLLFMALISLIGLIYHNDYNPDRMREFGNIRWITLFYTMVFSFSVVRVKEAPHWVRRLLLMSICIGIYAFFQSYTGIDLIRWDNRAVQFDHYDKFPYYRASGFFSNPMTYGHSSAMWTALVFSFFLFKIRTPKKLLLPALAIICLFIGLYCCHTRGSWIAVFFGLLAVATLKNIKYGLFFLLFSIVGSGLAAFYFPHYAERLSTIFDMKFTSNVSRLYIWEAHFEIFKDYPWLGSGLNYNPYLLTEYYERLNTPTTYSQIGHAHNNYLQWLAGTGVFGLLAYLAFIGKALIISVQEYFKTSSQQRFIKSLLLGAIGAQVAFHFGGLTECNFRDAEVRSFFLTVIAVVIVIRIQRLRTEALSS